MTTETASSKAGRKRSDDSRIAILIAAFDLVSELGYAGLTIEGIAARAGTGKGTIRRWWPSKADVLLDALAAKADLFIPVPEEASYAADLLVFLRASFALGSRPAVAEVLRALMAHAQIDADFATRFKGSFLERRRDALRTILTNAKARGDLPPIPSVETALDIVFGVIWYRLLTDAVPNERDGQRLADELVAALARGAHV